MEDAKLSQTLGTQAVIGQMSSIDILNQSMSTSHKDKWTSKAVNPLYLFLQQSMSISNNSDSCIEELPAESQAYYVLPSDASETERLRINHTMWKLILEGLQTAPIQDKLQKGIKVLDIGCGPGWWSIDMAKRYPNSQFVGLDISDNFSRDKLPDNLVFELANAGQCLPFEDNEFDYVFQRFLVMGLPAVQYAFVVEEIKRVLKPGGTVEILEMVSSYDNPSPAFDCIGIWSKLIYHETYQFFGIGLDPQVARTVGAMLNHSGFTDVTDNLHQVPIGNWGGRIGALFLDVQKLALPAVMSIVLQLDLTQRPTFIKTMQEAFADAPNYKTSCEFHLVCAVKPT
ncbi:hypothetical protein INT43_005717 [Umbelopsis isabellina]|uniref:Methyltransferase domain-containing protein n=1 Tax=Mortierella isabellina TaxID=91625 RepID=A0A8H7PM15_MORIS|nr:hypothetical protein INT43_005717 [Umbelopsis isabellina]